MSQELEQIKIIYKDDRFEFKYMSNGIWKRSSDSSDLRRIENVVYEFTLEHVKNIMQIIWEEHDGVGQVSLLFEGTEEEFELFTSVYENEYKDSNIVGVIHSVHQSKDEHNVIEVAESEKVNDEPGKGNSEKDYRTWDTKKLMYEIGKLRYEQEQQNKIKEAQEMQKRIEQKKIKLLEIEEKAKKIVVTFSTAAGAMGALPIPFADMPMLIADQIAMLTAINAAFGFSFEKATMKTVVYGVFGIGGAAAIGRAMAGNLVKIIPGIGGIVGGTISGSTAALITVALGNSYIDVCKDIYMGELRSDDLTKSKGMDKLKWSFKKNLQKSKK